MKHSKTLFFIAPLNWNESNKQIQYFSQEMSAQWNILYFNAFEIPRTSIGSLFLSREQRKKAHTFFRQLFSHKTSLINETVFFTTKKYSSQEEFSFMDQFFFLLQIYLLCWITQGSFSEICFWMYSPFFPESLKKIKKRKIYYEFFDRYFALHDPLRESKMRTNENWLLENAERIFVHSAFYQQFVSEKIAHLKSEHDSEYSEGSNVEKIVRIPMGYFIEKHLRYTYHRNSQKIIVGYAGSISARLNYKLIEKIVKENPLIDFHFVGPISDDKSWISPTPKITGKEFVTKMKKYSNFIILPSQKNVDAQIREMQKFSIGWIPYDLKIPFNQYCNPTKFFEYLALGLPIVSTKIPSLMDYEKFIEWIGNGDDFFSLSQRLIKQSNQADIHQRKKFVKIQALKKKYQKVQKIIE
jgi:glycosyltransferase involved in cell wall biosynthesis